MLFVRRIVPVLTIIMATLLVVLPWGVTAQNRFFLPLLPLIVIHYWTLRLPDEVKDWWAFCAGLSVDILTNGPIGYWALIYLLGFAAAKLSTDVAGGSPVFKWLAAGATMIALTALGWVVSSLYYFEWADWRPYMTAAVASALVYPLIAIVLRGLGSHGEAPRNVLLKRGL